VTDDRKPRPFEDVKIHVRFKLFSLWTSVMFFYIYGDYFKLHQPGILQEMIAGRMALGAVSQKALVAMAAVMAIPSLMPFLSLVLPIGVNRWLNIVFGAVYSVIMMLAMRGGWHFYILFALIEVVLTAMIVCCAWTWPESEIR